MAAVAAVAAPSTTVATPLAVSGSVWLNCSDAGASDEAALLWPRKWSRARMSALPQTLRPHHCSGSFTWGSEQGRPIFVLHQGFKHVS